MKRVIIESPFAGDTEQQRALNLRYLRACIADSLARGEAPFASHAIYTQPGVLDDAQPEQRKLGIAAGYAWGTQADVVAFYVDLGVSKGMREAIDHYLSQLETDGHIVMTQRTIEGWR